MNIDWVIPCRYAEVHDNLATIVGAGIDTWWLEELPAPVQVGVVVRVPATADELGPDHEHTVRSIIRDPRGEVLSDTEDVFKAGSAEEAAGARDEWLNGMALATTVSFDAAEAGTYTFEHIVDGSSRSLPLHIVHGASH
jgi:hypothetical protein